MEGRAEQEVGAPETAQAGRLEAGKRVERASPSRKSVTAERSAGRQEEGGNKKVEHTAER